MEPTFKPVADYALLVNFAEEIGEEAHASVVALDKALAAAQPEGMTEVIPALVNLLVMFDPVVTDHLTMEDAVRKQLHNLQTQAISGVERPVQVCYEGVFAPDLDAVAQATGMSAEAVINAHLAGDYRVLMYGFAPGYAYLGGVPEVVQVPRKPTPVRDVAAGSVLIAGPQCLVTTMIMPTGWSIIGRSPTPVMTQDKEQPFLFDVGDTVVFERIDLAMFEKLSRKSDRHG
ncbi:MAG: 5-oxoprolinase subunit B family protein [Pikeienuella sp.]